MRGTVSGFEGGEGGGGCQEGGLFKPMNSLVYTWAQLNHSSLANAFACPYHILSQRPLSGCASFFICTGSSFDRMCHFSLRK